MAFLDFLPTLGRLGGSLLGLGSQALVNRAQMKLAEYQYEKNLDMWTRQNAYNTPKAQKERMMAAGLNPNLVYGHGSVVNTAGNAPSYDAPTLGAYTDFADLGAGESYQLYQKSKIVDADVSLKKAQSQGVIAQSRVSQMDALLKGEQILSQQIKNAIAAKDWERYDELLDLRIEYQKSLKANVDSMANYRDTVQTDLTKAQTNLANQQITYYDQKTKEIQFSNEFLNPLRARQLKVAIANAIKDIAVKDQNIKESKSREELNDWTVTKVSNEIYGIALSNSLKLSEAAIKQVLIQYGVDLNDKGLTGLVNQIIYAVTPKINGNFKPKNN